MLKTFEKNGSDETADINRAEPERDARLNAGFARPDRTVRRRLSEDGGSAGPLD